MRNKHEIEKKRGKKKRKESWRKKGELIERKEIERTKWYKMIQNDNNWIIWTANNIGAEGARMISEALKINTRLTELDLWGDEKEERWLKMKM